MSESSSSPRWRFRFSLRTFIISVVVVAVLGNIVLQMMALIPLRREVRQLREETGQLVIDDPTKLQAIKIETNQEFVWKWRVWIPAGRGFTVSYGVADIPADELSKKAGAVEFTPERQVQEVVVIAKIEKRVDGTVRCAVSFDDGYVRSVMDCDLTTDTAKKLTSSSRASFRGVGRRTTEEEPGKPFVLLRHRVFEEDVDLPNGPPLTDGIMVWFEDYQTP